MYLFQKKLQIKHVRWKHCTKISHYNVFKCIVYCLIEMDYFSPCLIILCHCRKILGYLLSSVWTLLNFKKKSHTDSNKEWFDMHTGYSGIFGMLLNFSPRQWTCCTSMVGKVTLHVTMNRFTIKAFKHVMTATLPCPQKR